MVPTFFPLSVKVHILPKGPDECNMFKVKSVKKSEGPPFHPTLKNVHFKTAWEVLKYTEHCEQELDVHLVRAMNPPFTEECLTDPARQDKVSVLFILYVYIHI